MQGTPLDLAGFMTVYPKKIGMLMIRIGLVGLLWLAVALPALGQDSGLAFLRVGTNAEAAAMGDAQVAFSRDAFSTYWNPAGLAAASRNSASASFHSWIGDTKTYAGALRLGVGDNGALGLFMTANGSDELEARTSPGDPQGSFSVQFVNVGVAYGRALGPVRAGVTAKYLNERIFTESSSGYGFDFGLQTSLFSEGLHLGAAVQNVGQMNELAQEDSELPKMLRVGAAFNPLRIFSFDDDVMLLETMLTGELVHLFPGETTQLHLGIGAEMFDVMELRAGYITNDALREFSFGLGFGYEGLIFDYAYVPFESGFAGPGHILTLSYEW